MVFKGCKRQSLTVDNNPHKRLLIAQYIRSGGGPGRLIHAEATEGAICLVLSLPRFSGRRDRHPVICGASVVLAGIALLPAAVKCADPRGCAAVGVI